MTTPRKPALLVGLGIAIFATTATATSVLLRFQPSLLSALKLTPSPASDSVCKTIATDPNPPLNVRTSPVVAPDNVVGRINNGIELTVIDENEGWFRISSPLEGWIYKNLTVTSCVPAAQATKPTSTDNGTQTLTEATDRYQSGNLNGAIALAQTIPPDSVAYQPAKAAIMQWQKDWKTAATEFSAAQKALNQGRWQDVLNSVENFPDNRFWRTKLTPIVKQAMQQQNEKK